MKCTSLGMIARLSLPIIFLLLATPSHSQTVIRINYPGSSESPAFGINNKNVIVGAFLSSGASNGAYQGYMLSGGTFSTIEFPSAYKTVPLSINNAGSVVGFYYDLTTTNGFLFSSGTYTAISFPGSTSTLAYGINDSGQIVGYYYTADGKVHGFELSQGVYSTIDCPCGGTYLQGINNTGTIAGYYLDSSNIQHGLLYDSGSFTTVDYPGATDSLLYGINNSGTVVGFWENGSSTGAFEGSNGRYSAIAVPPPAKFIGYLGINDSGQIVGEGYDFSITPVIDFGFLLSSGPFAYVGNTTSPNCCTLTVLDTQTNLVAATIAVGYGGVPFAVSPDQTRIYLANNNTVEVVDTRTNSIVATVPGVGPNANAVTIAPNGNFGYTANNGSVSVFNTSTNTVVATVPVGFPAGYVTVTPDGAHLYVSGTGSTIAVINTSTNQVESTFSIPLPPGGLNADFGPFLLPNGSLGYVGQDVASVTPGTVTAITIPGNQTVATIPVGTQPAGIAVSPDGSYVYVADSGSNNVSVIDTSSNQVIATIPVGNDPITLAVSPDGSFVYVGNFTDSSLSVIQTSTNSIIATIPVASPFGIIIPSSPPVSQAITQPLSPTAPNTFNFGPHSFTVQYPAGTSFSGVNMTVAAAQTTSTSFSQRVAGTQFANARCIIYSGAGGNCVDYQVTCSSTSGGTITCPSVATPTITVKTSFDTQQLITNPGFLTTPIGTNNWTNIFEAFYLQRIDPTVKGRTNGFSEFVAVDLGASNGQGAGTLKLLDPLQATDARVFPVGTVIPVRFTLSSLADPAVPITDAKAGLAVVQVTDANGNGTANVVLDLPKAFSSDDDDNNGRYHYALNTTGYAPGTYALTIYGNAFAAQQVEFTLPLSTTGAQLVTTVQSLTLNASAALYLVVFSVQNVGSAVANAVIVSGSSLNEGRTSTPLPVSLGDIAPGATATVTLSYPQWAGLPGSRARISINEVYAGGTFGAGLRVQLP